MNIQQDVLDKIKDLYLYIQDYVISVVLGGSYTLDYIFNRDDIDIFYICKNDEKCKDALLKYAQWRQLGDNKEFKYKHKISILFYTIDMYDQKMIDRPWIYLFNFQIVLHGKYRPQYDILSQKEDYKKVLRKALNYVIEYKEKEGKYHKWIYHILSGIYMMENNSYELTNEQIEDVNICHDLINISRIEKLFNFCKSYLQINE